MALFDMALVASLVALYGPGGLIAGFYLAVLPYSLDQSQRVAALLILLGALTYLAAAGIHGWVFADGQRGILDLPSGVYVEAAVFAAVAVAVRHVPATLARRLRATRAVVGQAEQGDLWVRAHADHADELGYLEKSLNRLLEQTAVAISEVRREADEVAACARVLADCAGEGLTSSQGVAATAAELARGLSEQRDIADTGREEGVTAAQEADGLRARAEIQETDVRRLVEAADRGRARVVHASETLTAIGDDVRTTAAIIEELSGLSERVAVFAQTVAKIARRTRLLALNAAVEAARAEEHGEGFAAVSEEVRALAGEGARAARDMADVITEVRSRIDAVGSAMAAGSERVRDVGAVAAEARSALEDIHAGAVQAAELVTTTSEVSRAQAERMGVLAEQMSRLAELSVTSSAGADGAARSVAAQISAMDNLNQLGRQLTELAGRLRASVARFSSTGSAPAVNQPCGDEGPRA